MCLCEKESSLIFIQCLPVGGGLSAPLVYSLRLTENWSSLCENESSIRCVCLRMGVVCVKGEYSV